MRRQDDWYDMKGNNVVYQERSVRFCNLFSVHTRSREVAPLVHDLMDRVGRYKDSARSIEGEVRGDTPGAPQCKLDLAMARVSDTDGQGPTLQTITNHQPAPHALRALGRHRCR